MGAFGHRSVKRLRAKGDVAGLVDALIRANRHNRPEQMSKAADALVALGEPGVDALVAALGNDDPSVRGCSVAHLRHAKDPRVVRLLIAALGDPDKSVRCAAALSLGELNDPEVIEALAGALDDEDPFVRNQAAYGLAKWGDRRAVDELIRIALHALGEGVSGDTECRMALEALGRLGDNRAVPALAEILRSDPWPDVHRDALHALKLIGGPDADAALALDSDALARWGPAPAGNCDLCSAPISAEDGWLVPNAEFRDLVSRGYDPHPRGQVRAITAGLAEMLGQGPEYAYAGWVRMVMTHDTDWALCLDCAYDLAAFAARTDPDPSI